MRASAPVRLFSLPLFNEAGHREMLVRASEASVPDQGHIEIVGLHLTTFDGTADARVTNILVSPLATAWIEERRVAGPGAVRLVRDDVEVQGEDWSYDHAARRVVIGRNAVVSFNAQINDLLK